MSLDFKTYCRTSLDSDATELPDALLDVWQLEALYRIRAALGGIHSAEFAWELSVTASTQSYALNTFAGAGVEQITGVTSSHWALQPLPHETAEQFYQWQQAQGTTEFGPTNTGTPIFWSVGPTESIGRALYLWPSPSSDDTLQVRGQSLLDIETDGVNAALPAELEPLVGEYMVARGLEMQANVFLSMMKFNRFEAELDVLVRRQRRPDNNVTVIGGGKFKAPNIAPGRLPFSWEA